jgi:hypothetical protein
MSDLGLGIEHVKSKLKQSILPNLHITQLRFFTAQNCKIHIRHHDGHNFMILEFPSLQPSADSMILLQISLVMAII